jgi:hypothetical protein
MYTFVFMWTPALKSVEETQAEAAGTASIGETTSSYLGLIFAVFMVCVMIGSSCFKLFSARREMLYKIPLYMHATAFAAMACVALFLEHKLIVYTAFLVFEGTVGVFYPSYGVIKSEKIPEDIRSAVMNIFRIPPERIRGAAAAQDQVPVLEDCVLDLCAGPRRGVPVLPVLLIQQPHGRQSR